MASSYKEGKNITAGWLTQIKPETALDIGPGCGTYWALCNGLYGKWLGEDFPDYKGKPPLMVAIEAYYPYIEKFKLNDKYNQVIVSDARYFDFGGYSDKQFDVAFLGDVLEHMTKTEALLLFGSVRRVAKNVIVSLPIVNFPQGAILGNPFEVHVKEDWTHDEFVETFGTPAEYHAGKDIGVYLYGS